MREKERGSVRLDGAPRIFLKIAAYEIADSGYPMVRKGVMYDGDSI